MARPRSPEKRSALLHAAVREIAEVGLGAATAKIASRAGVATGTLFAYFATKDELLNELYLELKAELSAHITNGFPGKASLENRVRHLWSRYFDWAIDLPQERRVSQQLTVSAVLTAATRTKASAQFGAISQTIGELENRSIQRGLPTGFASSALVAMQEAAMEFVAKRPKDRAALIEASFQAYWRAFK